LFGRALDRDELDFPVSEKKKLVELNCRMREAMGKGPSSPRTAVTEGGARKMVRRGGANETNLYSQALDCQKEKRTSGNNNAVMGLKRGRETAWYYHLSECFHTRAILIKETSSSA